jgi:hypothetical protein
MLSSPSTAKACELPLVGRTTPLNPAQAGELTTALTPAAPDHPRPDRIGTGRFGGGQLSVPLTKVEPRLVVEASARRPPPRGRLPHPLRFVRTRPDHTPDDVPPI